MGFSILSTFPEGYAIFPILRWAKLIAVGNTESLVFIWAWSSIFSSETVVTQINHPFMFQVPHICVQRCASDGILWIAKHYCQVRAGLRPRLQRHKCQVRAGLGFSLLWVNIYIPNFEVFTYVFWPKYYYFILSILWVGTVVKGNLLQPRTWCSW